jgi:hypothetical protein
MERQQHHEKKRTKERMEDIASSSVYRSSLDNVSVAVKRDDVRARKTLSKFAFQEIWRKTILTKALQMEGRQLEDGTFEVKMPGKEWSSASTVRILCNERCNCSTGAEYDVQCPHEYVRDGKVLQLDLYNRRWLKEQLNEVNFGHRKESPQSAVADLAGDADADEVDPWPQQDNDDPILASLAENDPNTDDEDDVTLLELGGNTAMTRRKRRSETAEITYNQLNQLHGDAMRAVMNDPSKKTVYAAMLLQVTKVLVVVPLTIFE